MNKLKRLTALVTAAVFFAVSMPTAFADREADFSDDFESYPDAASVVGGGFWNQLTNESSSAAELLTSGDNKYYSIKSASNGDCILLSKADMFTAEQTRVTLRLSTATPGARAGNDLCAHILVRAAGKNYRLADFGYNTLRYNNEAFATGVKANQWFNCDILFERGVGTDGKAMLTTTFTVGSKSVTTTQTGLRNNFDIQIGLKSVYARDIAIDDVKVYSMSSVAAALNADGDTQYRIDEPLVLSLDPDQLDVTTLTNDAIKINGEPLSGIKSENGAWVLEPSQPLAPSTDCTVTLDGIKSISGGAASPGEFKFRTRKSALSSRRDGADFTVTNKGTAGEPDWVIKPAYNSDGSLASVGDDGTVNANITAVQTAFEPNAVHSYDSSELAPIYIADSEMRPVEYSSAKDGDGLKNDEFTAEFSDSTSFMTVSGKTGRAAVMPVALWVSNPGCTLDLSDDSLSESIQYVGITETDSEGYFSLSFPIDGFSGVYAVRALSAEDDFAGTCEVRSANDINKILSVLNSASSTKDDVKNLFATYPEALKVDFAPFDALADKDFVYGGLLLTAKENDGGRYRAVEEVIDDVKSLTVLSMLNASDDADTAALMQQYDEQVKIESIAPYEIWKDASDETRSAAIKAAHDSAQTTMNKFRDALSRTLLLGVISSSNQWGAVKEIIESYPTLLGLDLTVYDRYSKPAYVAKQLVGGTYTQQTLKTEFDRVMNEYIASLSGGSNSGGGGGGKKSGAGGGISAIATPNVTPVIPDAPDNSDSGGATYSDMDGAEWAQKYVDALSSYGIINGYEDGTFRPDESVSREAFVKMAVMASGKPIVRGADEFADVGADEWYAPYISAAKNMDLIRGRADGTFGVGENISRQDAAVILCAVIKNSGRALPAGENRFADANDIADYAAESAAALSALGVISGNPDGTFNPLGMCTRAEAAKMIYGIMEVIR